MGRTLIVGTLFEGPLGVPEIVGAEGVGCAEDVSSIEDVGCIEVEGMVASTARHFQ